MITGDRNGDPQVVMPACGVELLILDGPRVPLNEATKRAPISTDSIQRSELSAGLPLDLLVYQKDARRAMRFVSKIATLCTST